MAFKPDGYTSVSPYLLIADAEVTLRFIEAVFGAGRLRIVPREDGHTRHAEARIDDTVIMMGEVEDAPPAHVHVYVPDVDAAFARALAAGGTEVHAITEQGDGDRRGGVADPNGTVWWLSTQIEPAAP